MQIPEEQLQRLERILAALADGRKQTVEQFCAYNRNSDIRGYQLAAHVQELIDEIRRLRGN